MNRRSVTGVVVVLVIILIAAAIFAHKSNNNSTANNTNSTPSASNNNTAPQNNQTPQASGTVDIRNMMFTPSQITVGVGQKVTWTNNDSTTHTVVDDLSNVGGPNSGDIAPGQSYSFTFQKAGSYQYHCSIHPSMRGTIVVK